MSYLVASDKFKWTPEAEAILREMYEAGALFAEIADKIGGGVTSSACEAKRKDMKIPARNRSGVIAAHFLSPLHPKGSMGRAKMRAYISSELQTGRDPMDIVDELMSHGHTYDRAYDFVKRQLHNVNFVKINSRSGFKPGPREDGMIEFAPGHMTDLASFRLIEKARGMR